MPTTINGTTGVSQVQDGTITSAKIVDGTVAQTDLDATNKLAQCKAWVNFDGTLSGTITPRASFNVTNVTKNGTGDYTINFTTPLLDANYVVSGAVQRGATNDDNHVAIANAANPTTAALRIAVVSNGTANDASRICVTIFGN